MNLGMSLGMFNSASFTVGTPMPVAIGSSVTGGANPLTLPSHLAGDLILAIRARTVATAQAVSAPWANVFTPLEDGDGGPCTFQLAAATAPSNDGLTYPFTGSGRHAYWHFRHAKLGTKIDSDSGQTGTAVTVPSLADLATGSWVIGGFYSRNDQTQGDMQAMNPSYTERFLANGTSNELILYDSNGIVTSFAGDGATMTSETGGWCGFAVEIARSVA